MKQFRLKDNHPTKVKYDKLVELAEDLGISLSFTGDVCTLEDQDQPGVRFFVEDIETGLCGDFPHGSETKITFRKEG